MRSGRERVERRRKLKAFLTAMAGAGVVGGVVLMIKNRKPRTEYISISVPSASSPALLPSFRKKVKSIAVSKSTSQSEDSTPALPSSFNAAQMAEDLFSYARRQNITGVLFVLKQIANTSEYSLVSEEFKKVSDRNTLVRYTLVTGLLEKYFADEDNAKELIKAEFKRMGLKTDSSGKWTLSGFSVHKDIISIAPTYVKDWMGNRIIVKANTILGDEKSVSDGMTWFVGLDGKTYQVPTRDVKYL